ncbi:hypothetical protein GJ496_000351 [Pomphorhynchus laevis]|nr:hypothetical protein GJ496_000351 [Pomphorhynchus laevis]
MITFSQHLIYLLHIIVSKLMSSKEKHFINVLFFYASAAYKFFKSSNFLIFCGFVNSDKYYILLYLLFLGWDLRSH